MTVTFQRGIRQQVTEATAQKRCPKIRVTVFFCKIVNTDHDNRVQHDDLTQKHDFRFGPLTPEQRPTRIGALTPFDLSGRVHQIFHRSNGDAIRRGLSVRRYSPSFRRCALFQKSFKSVIQKFFTFVRLQYNRSVRTSQQLAEGPHERRSRFVLQRYTPRLLRKKRQSR